MSNHSRKKIHTGNEIQFKLAAPANDLRVMVRLETILHIWNKLISMQILIIIMSMSIFADDGRTGLMNIIILLGLTNPMVKGIRLKYSLFTVDNIA